MAFALPSPGAAGPSAWAALPAGQRAIALGGLVERLQDLPPELRAAFGRLGQLDVRAAALQESADLGVAQRIAVATGGDYRAIAAAIVGLTPAAPPPPEAPVAAEAPVEGTTPAPAAPAPPAPDVSLPEEPPPGFADGREIESMGAEAVRLCEEKVGVATQLYDLVDETIRMLDRDSILMAALTDLGLPMAAPGAGQRKSAAKADGPAGGAALLDMPVDPNEPTYCTCQKVSYGDMIGCDDAACRVEWFHYECVGLTKDTAPKSNAKWYCPACRARRAANPKAARKA